jgi:DNA-binding transcriptional ArsR family regulator
MSGRYHEGVMTTRADPDRELARVASMIGDPTRATMLGALLGGEALPAGELARRAGVAPATATSHLARLVEHGLLTRRQSGRHRYFALANADVAAALEALGRVAPLRDAGAVASQAPNGSIRFARTCYDHLAGVLGVMVTERMLERRFIVGTDGYELSAAGGAWLTSLGVDVDALRRSRRAVARPCLDWTERRDHLAGGAGAAVASIMFERRWIARVQGTRAVRLTLSGREALYRMLGLEYL